MYHIASSTLDLLRFSPLRSSPLWRWRNLTSAKIGRVEYALTSPSRWAFDLRSKRNGKVRKKTREISASLTLFHSFETTRRLVFDYVSNAVKPRRRSRRIVQRKGNVVARDSLKLAFAFV